MKYDDFKINNRLLKVINKEKIQKNKFTNKKNEERFTRLKTLLKLSKVYEIVNMLDIEYKKTDLYILKFIGNHYKNNSNKINYLLYIFFYIIPTSRRIIQDIQGRSRIDPFGKLFIINTINYRIYHNFNMDRFVEYNRLNIILNKINIDRSNIELDISSCFEDLESFITERKYNH